MAGHLVDLAASSDNLLNRDFGAVEPNEKWMTDAARGGGGSVVRNMQPSPRG